MERPEDIVKMIIKYKRNGTAIDLGAGKGRNTLFLARRGFKVTAVDVHPSSIQEILEEARKERLQVNGVVGDIRNFKFENPFDVIVVTYALQHISDEEALNLIERVRKNTRTNGLNVIAAYTKRGPVHPTDKYLPEEGELKRRYTDWEILYYKVGYVTIQTLDGRKMKKHTTKLIARKL